jgi:hypothetical protein
VNAVARMLRALVAAAALLGLLPAVALAQETREYDLPDLEQSVREEPSLRDLIKVRLKASNRFVGPSDFGDYSATSYQPEFRAKVTAPLAENAGIRLMGTGRILHYDFDGSSADLGIANASDGPFDDLYAWTVRLQGAYLLDEDWTLFSDRERWSLLMDSFVRASWEKGADMSESVGGGGSLALGYRLGKKFELALGASLRTKLRTGELALAPLAEFDWRINRQWKISSQGLGLQVERRLGERFTLFSRARLESSSYLLGGRAGGVGDTYLGLRQLPAGLGLWWNVGRHLRVTTLGGVMAMHRLRVYDSDNRRIDSDSAAPSPYFLIRFDLRS